MPDSLRIGFAGTPEFAATLLQGLLDAGYTPKLVLTQPDRPTGRGRKLKPSAVKALAASRDLPVETPTRLKDYRLPELDLLIVAAYGLILPPAILTSPRHGCLNVHASLLPRWRGAAPVERAIMAGDRETGVCLMQMDAGLDTGPVYRCAEIMIDPAETGGTLEARLAELGTELLIRTLPDLPGLTARPQPDAGVTYAEKLSPRDSVLDWNRPAAEIARQIQALADRQPVTVYLSEETGTDTGPGERVRVRLLGASTVADVSQPDASDHPAECPPPGTILRVTKAGLQVSCADGPVSIATLQLNRGKGTAMAARAAANGYPDLIAPGRRFLTRPGP